MDVDDPFYQETSWGVFDFRLYFLQIFMINWVEGFFIQHWLEDLLRIFSDALWISHIKLITQWHILFNWFLIVINSLSAFLSDLFSSLLLLWYSRNILFLLSLICFWLTWWSWGQLATWFRWFNCRLIIVNMWDWDIWLDLLDWHIRISVFLLLTSLSSWQINVPLRAKSRVCTLKNDVKFV